MINNPHVRTNIVTYSNRNVADEFEWQRFRVEQICEILRNIEPKEVGADIGCHSGLATALYAATGITTLHGYDISEKSLENLRAKGFEGFYWNVDGGKCPAADNTYDVIVAGEIIEHLVDTDTFARELFRILKPGGQVILTTPNLASWYNRLRLLRGRVPRTYPGTSSTIKKDLLIDNNHLRINVLSEWVYFLQAHHFEIKSVQGSTHLQVLKGSLKIALLKWIDRLACKKPSLAVNLIIVAAKPS